MNPHQLTPEWHAARAGKITCSRLGAILGLDPYCTPKRYWEELVGLREPFAGNAATRYGQEHERDARWSYECEIGDLVELCGFVTHPYCTWFGGSPDGLVGDECGVEFKCIYRGELPEKPKPAHEAQCRGLMAVTRRISGIWDLYYWTPNATRRFCVQWDPVWWMNAWPKVQDFHNAVTRKEWK
jgi:putative phage-type endonuclease